MVEGYSHNNTGHALHEYYYVCDYSNNYLFHNYAFKVICVIILSPPHRLTQSCSESGSARIVPCERYRSSRCGGNHGSTTFSCQGCLTYGENTTTPVSKCRHSSELLITSEYLLVVAHLGYMSIILWFYEWVCYECESHRCDSVIVIVIDVDNNGVNSERKIDPSCDG